MASGEIPGNGLEDDADAGPDAAEADVKAGAADPADASGDFAAAVPDDVAGNVDAASEDGANLPVEEGVRRRVAALDGIVDLPLSEHAQRYDEVHAELQAALTEIDGESG